jgi:lysyl-tRNA synthetase class 2
MLALRSRALRAIREWFWSAGFAEVETPVRVAAPAPEVHIDALPAGDAWLRTSPELEMKRLLAAGAGRIFQIGPCFRAGERGRRHNPEFTLLEWYRSPGDADAVLRDCEELLRHVVRQAGRGTLARNGRTIDLSAPWPRLAVRQAFRDFAGWDPVAAYDADRFDLDLVNKVEPSLPADRPCVLTGYPAAAAALARLKPDGETEERKGVERDPIADRWELYIGGLELANAYGELTDAAEQRRRFAAWREQRRRAGRPDYPPAEAFLAALEAGMPPCGGIALGVDRLVMLLAGAETIAGVRPFCEG